jgi:hypothetical protein
MAQRNTPDASQVMEFLNEHAPVLTKDGIKITIDGMTYLLTLKGVTTSSIGYLAVVKAIGKTSLAAYKAAIGDVMLRLDSERQKQSLSAVADGKAAVADNQQKKYHPVDMNGNEIESRFADDGRIRVQGTASLYIVPGRGIGTFKIYRDKDSGEEVEEFIPQWDAQYVPTVHRRLDTHEGQEGERTKYDITIAGTRHIVSKGTLKRGMWVDLFPGAAGVLDSTGYNKYLAVISTLATNAPLVHAPLTTGFLNLSGDDTSPDKRDYVYLLPDGRYFTPSGDVRRDEQVTLAQDVLTPQQRELWDNFEIPTSGTVEEQREFFAWLIKLSPKTLRILAHGARAHTSDIRTPQEGAAHAMTIVAPRGQGKSALAAMVGRGIWPYRLKPLPDASYNDTAATIEHNLAGFRSFPTLLDDLVDTKCVPGSSESRAEGEKADRLARALHDERPVRQRMTSSMQRQKANIIRSMFVNTWESTPDVPASFWRRTTLLTFDNGEILTHRVGGADVASLEDIPRYWNIKVFTFYQLIIYQLRQLQQYGMRAVATSHMQFAARLRTELEKKFLREWESAYPGIELPPDYSNLLNLYSQEALGLRMIEQSSGFKNMLVPHAVPVIVKAMVEQAARMSGLHPDEDGATDIDTAIAHILESIASVHIVDGHTWHIERYVTRGDIAELPQAYRADGSEVPASQWGSLPSMEDARPPLTVAYVDDCCTYILQPFRKALMRELGLASDKALSQALDRAGWLERINAKDKRCTRNIRPHGQWVSGVFAIKNERFLPLVGAVRLDSGFRVSDRVQARLREAMGVTAKGHTPDAGTGNEAEKNAAGNADGGDPQPVVDQYEVSALF